MSLTAHSWLENILLADRRAHEGLTGYTRRILRSLLRAGRRGSGPPAFGRFHRRRLLLDDGVDQRRAVRNLPAQLIERGNAKQPRATDVLDALPKAELHLHLEGSIRPETVAVELAARHGVTLTPEEVAARYNYSNFAGFIEAFKWVTSFLRDPEDYALITRQLAEELVRQNVVYAEITISAGVMLRRMQNVEANFTAIRETSRKPCCSAACGSPGFSTPPGNSAPRPAMEVARWAAKLQRSGRRRFRNGRRRAGFPTVNFRPAFDLARNEGLRIVCHAGEVGGPASVREAVEFWAPSASATASP